MLVVAAALIERRAVTWPEKKGATNEQINKQTRTVVRGRQAERGWPGHRGRRIVIQIASGADYPTVPPGLIILLAVAALVAPATRWRWPSVVGVIAPAFLLVGGAIAPQTRDHLGDPSRTGVLVGTVIQLLALVVALVAGLAATRQAYRTQIRT